MGAHYAAVGAARPCNGVYAKGKPLRRAKEDSYGLIDLENGAAVPAYYAFWLWNRYGGSHLISTRIARVRALDGSELSEVTCKEKRCVETATADVAADDEEVEVEAFDEDVNQLSVSYVTGLRAVERRKSEERRRRRLRRLLVL